MTKIKKESFFWTSYSDLMTSMFFVMLILFVLTVVVLNNKMRDPTLIECQKETDSLRKETDSLKKELQKAQIQIAATQKELDKIKEIEESVKNIDSTYFQYDSGYKRHTLKNITVSFNRGSSDIIDIPFNDRKRLQSVGTAIKQFVDNAVKKNSNVKYLLILEGQSSKDGYSRNYELSYERALALYRYWQNNGIKLDTAHCEVIISGSGEGSSFREQPDNSSNRQNQRFVIHIIPKPGIIK